MAFAREAVKDGGRKFTDICGAQVWQVMALSITPARFDRVEFRGIARQPFELKPIGMNPRVPSCCRTMCIQTIPNDDEFVVQVVVKLSQKLNYISRYKAVCCQPEIERRVFLRWGQHQSTNCRHSSIMPSRDQLQRCFSAWRPGTLPVGLQQEASFVDENDASFVVKPPFLSAAIRVFSTGRRTRDPAPAPDAVASGTTSPTCARVARRDLRRTPLRSVAGSLRRHADMSKDHWQTPLPVLQVRGFARHTVAERRSIAMGDRDEAWTPMRRGPLSQRLSANAPHYSTTSQRAARPPHVTCLIKTSYSQSAASVPIPLPYLWFSCWNRNTQR